MIASSSPTAIKAAFRQTGVSSFFFSQRATKLLTYHQGPFPFDPQAAQSHPALKDVEVQNLARARTRTQIKTGFFLSGAEALTRIRERDAAVAARVATRGARGRGRARGRLAAPDAPPQVRFPISRHF